MHGAWSGGADAGGAPVLRAFNADSAEHLAELKAWASEPILVDARIEGMHGGTGRRVPEELLHDISIKYILAGGLRPENVAEIIRRVRPWGVDVASGVESSPGRKDHAAVRAFVRAARTAFSTP